MPASGGGGGGPIFPSPEELTESLGRISGPLLSANLLRNGVDLAFHNNSETDNLLYLDVTSGFIGINTDAPSQALTINGFFDTTNLIVDTQAELGNIVFNTYRIQDPSGQINIVPNQLLDPKVVTNRIGTSNLRFSDQLIENITSNSDIIIQANGLGRIEFTTTNVDVQGNLHATGNITFDGDVTFGDANTDNVIINADIDSNLIPDVTNQFNLGAVDKRWNNVYIKDIVSTEINSQELIVNNINYVLEQGQTIYVSQEGIDENYGTHQQSTFKTIKHALSQAQAGDEIIIFPGDYEEIFPLTVPNGVAVKGFGIRSVNIFPTDATKFNDAFLLNGDTTVEFLTVKNFYYDSVANTGYGFRFAPGATTIARSPYVHNITVITQLSTVTESPYGTELLDTQDYPGSGFGLSFDPYAVQVEKSPLPANFNTLATPGTKIACWIVDPEIYDTVYTVSSVVTDPLDSNFWLVTVEEPFANLDQGKPFYLFDGVPTSVNDSGRGILVDGSALTPSSKEASMLFFSVTLITPNADGITITNGARVEWLNSFTYFAYRGIHLIEGTSGFTQFGGTDPGVVNVGPGPTLFSYTSDSVALDKSFYNQALVDSLVGQQAIIDRYPNPPLVYTVVSIETEPLNTALWRMTVDTAFDPSGQLKPISFYPDIETTLIVTNGIWDTTGNSVGEKWVAWFKSNLLPNFETIVGPDWTINVAGTLYIVDYVIQDPVNTNMWRIYVTTSLVAGVGIPIFSSPGVGTVTRSTVEMRSINSANVYGTYGAVADGANTLAYLIGHNFGYIGTGLNSLNDRSIVIQANEVVEQNNGKIYYDSVDHKGDYRIGNIFYVNQETGQVIFDAQSIDFGAQGNITLEGPDSTTVIDRFAVQTGNIRIYDNNINSITGPINIVADNNITNLNTDVFVTGNLDVTGDVNVDGDVFLGDQPFNDTVSVIAKVTTDLLPNQNNFYELGSNSLRWQNAYLKLIDIDGITQISNNTIQTLTTDTDLKFQAATTGIVQVTTTNVQVDNDLTVNLHSEFYSESVTTNVDALTLDTGIVVITGNSITTKNNSDLELQSSIGSIVSIGLNDVEVDNNLVNNSLSTFKNTNITGSIVHYGDYNLTGNKIQAGSAEVSNISVTEETQLYNININNNVIQTILLNSNLIIGTQVGGSVNVQNNNLEITNDLKVLGTSFFDSVSTLTTIESDVFTTGNILITDNSITTSVNSDLRLLANGTGNIYIPLTNLEILNNLTVFLTTTLKDSVDVNGDIELYGLYDQTGDRNQTGSTTVSNKLTVTESAQFIDFNITDNVISTTVTDSDLKLGAVGTNIVNVKNTNVEILQDLTVGGNFTVNGDSTLKNTTILGDITLLGNIDQTGNTDIIGTFANNNISVPSALAYFSVPNIKILGNEISITALDTDLQFTANGNGSIIVDDKIKFTSNNVTNVWPLASTDLQKSLLVSPNGIGNAVIDSTTSLVLPVGNTSTRTLVSNGEVRFNNTSLLFEGYQTAGLVSFKDLYDNDRNTYVTSELTPGFNDKIIRFGVNEVVVARLDDEKFYSNSLYTSSINITGNTISSINSANNINFVVSGTGETAVNGISFQDNKIINNTNNAIILNTTNRGYVKFAGSAGLVIPAGTSSERPPIPEIGQTRWNTDSGNERLETWDGSAWIASIGQTGSVNVGILEEITSFWGIVLG